MSEQLVRVQGVGRKTGPFTAALIYDTKKDACVHAAPILRYMIGKTGVEIRRIGVKQGWRLSVVRVPP
jgi:hypothetical protein